MVLTECLIHDSVLLNASALDICVALAAQRLFNKSIKNYFRYRDWEYNPVEYLLLDDRKLALIIVSKVACTSIKATIGRDYGISFAKESGLDIHTHAEWHREYGRNFDAFSHYYLAVFVRNPFSRLVSCYKDRVQHDRSRQDIGTYYFSGYPYVIPPNSTFEEFAGTISEIPDRYADRHFKRQSYSVYRESERKNPDFIGRFESLQEDWQRLAKQFGLSPELAKLNTSRSAQGPVAGGDNHYRNAR